MRELFSEIVGLLPNSRIEALSEAEDLFEYMNFSGHHYALNNIIGGDPVDTGIEYGNSIESCYYDALIENLSVFGIRVTAEVMSVSELVEIMRGMVSLSHPNNLDIIEDIMDEEGSPGETLATLLSEVSFKDNLWFLDRFDYVDPDLMIRIRAEVNDIEFAEEMDELKVEIVNRYRNYMTPEKAGFVYEQLDDVSFLPMNYRTMVIAMQKELKLLNDEALIEELFQLNILSNSDVDDFIDNVSLVAKAFYPEDLTRQLTLEKLASGRVE